MMFLLLMLVFNPLSYAADVNWLTRRPQILDNDLIGITIIGQAQPGARVELTSPRILLLDPKPRTLDKAQVLLTPEPIIANDRGQFTVRVQLPPGTAQIALVVKQSGEDDRPYQLTLDADPKKARPKKPTRLAGHSLWFGSGYNYLIYSQKDSTRDRSFRSFRGPSWFAEARYLAFENWLVMGSYKTAPGEVLSGESTFVSDGLYEWVIISGEALHTPKTWKTEILDRTAQFGLRFGVQQHSVPFLLNPSTNNFRVQNNALTMLTFGGQFDIEVAENLGFEMYMRYQHPVRTGDLFTVGAQFAFDGSVGASYRFKNRLAAGLFWYGQYQRYTFKQTSPPAGMLNLEGSQALLYSTLEARIGYMF